MISWRHAVQECHMRNRSNVRGTGAAERRTGCFRYTLRVNHQTCMDLLSQSRSELKTLALSCFCVLFKSSITFKFPMVYSFTSVLEEIVNRKIMSY